MKPSLRINGPARISYQDFVKCYDSYWMAKFLAANTHTDQVRVDWTANKAYYLIPPAQIVNFILNAAGVGTFEYISQDMQNVKSALNQWKFFRKDVLPKKWRRLHRDRDLSIYREMMQMDKDKHMYLHMTQEKFREVAEHNEQEMRNLTTATRILMATAYTGAIMFAAGTVIILSPAAAALAAGSAEPAAVLQLVSSTKQVLLWYAVARGAMTTAVDMGNPGAMVYDMAPPVAHLGPEALAHTLHRGLEQAEEVVEVLKHETEETAQALYELLANRPLPAGATAMARFESLATKLKPMAANAEKFANKMLVVSAGFELIHGAQEMHEEYNRGKE